MFGIPSRIAHALSVVAMVAVMLGITGCGAHGPSSNLDAALSSFAVAASGRTPDDVLPRQVAEQLSANTAPEFDPADLRAARRILALSAVWLVPASNGEVCLVREVEPLIAEEDAVPLQPAVAVGCTPEAAADEGQLVVAQGLARDSRQAPRFRVVGVVPNNVGSVEVLYGPKKRISVPVVRNAYEAVVLAPHDVRFEAGGSQLEHHEVSLLPEGFHGQA